MAVGCSKTEKKEQGLGDGPVSFENKVAALMKERTESKLVTKECQNNFKGCRFDRAGDSKSLDSGEPYLSCWYEIPIKVFDGTDAKLEYVSFGLSITKYETLEKAKAEANDSTRDNIGRYLVTASCVGKKRRSVNDQEAMNSSLELWVSSVVAGL
jgi:hypothetical protein